MVSSRSILVTAGLAFILQSALAAEISLTIHPDREVNRIDEKVYGHFLEHIYHSVNGGLWGDLVWNRSFEQNAMGNWAAADNCVVQEGLGTNQRLTFGSADWTDYEFTVEAQKTAGSEGFLILFRCKTEDDFYWCNLGGWGNVFHQLERGRKGEGRWHGVGPRIEGSIEAGPWYRIRVRCQGAHIQVSLDGKEIIDFTDPDGHVSGKVGIGTWATQAKYRNLKVTSLTGEVLFEGLPDTLLNESVALHWTRYGPGKVSIVAGHAANSRCSQRVIGTIGETGIEQSHLVLRKGETYAGSLFLRGQAPNGVIVRLKTGTTTVASQRLVPPGDQWQEYPLALSSSVDAGVAKLQVALPGLGDVLIDQVSLMPDSWRQGGGYRPDLLEAVAQLRPPVIRWPGGCFASPYRWKDAIGPQSQRKIYPREIWDDQDVNSFGVDEFVTMCQKIGSEPLIVVNIGTRTWNGDVDRQEFLQDVLDWIEYCNGPATSRWGAVRAQNGHPQPYQVKYWEIDNETWHMGVENYATAVKMFAPAMRKADASIKLAACGSAGYGEQGDGLAWNRTMIRECANLVDYLSIHHYENPAAFAEGPRRYEAFFQKTAEAIAASENPQLRIYVSEWNAQSTDWRTGLYCGGLLNAFERCGAFLEMGGPALFLRHTSATAWDNAFINFNQGAWFPAPNYVVMKLWRDAYAPIRVDTTGDSQPLNAVATKTADGKTCVFKVVNPSESPHAVSLAIDGDHQLGEPRLALVAPGATTVRNSIDTPHAVRPSDGEVTRAASTVRFTLPPLSVAVVTIPLGDGSE